MQIPLTLEWLKYIFGQQHDSITCHLSSHKVEALWKSTVHNVLNSRLPRNRVLVGWAANCELAFYHRAPSEVNLQEMLVSLFSFVPQTEPEVFTGQWGEHRDLFLAPNNYNHAVAIFFFYISRGWKHTVCMKDNWKEKCQNCKVWDVFLRNKQLKLYLYNISPVYWSQLELWSNEFRAATFSRLFD